MVGSEGGKGGEDGEAEGTTVDDSTFLAPFFLAFLAFGPRVVTDGDEEADSKGTSAVVLVPCVSIRFSSSSSSLINGRAVVVVVVVDRRTFLREGTGDGGAAAVVGDSPTGVKAASSLSTTTAGE